MHTRNQNGLNTKGVFIYLRMYAHVACVCVTITPKEKGRIKSYF